MLAVASVSALMACGPGEMMMTPDGGTGDSGMMQSETGTPDSSMPAGNVCAAASVIDLSMRGMRAGNRTTFTGTTAMAAGTQQITPPSGCVAESARAIRQVAHTYRMNTAGFLRASTNVAATPHMGDSAHDTVVWMQNVCDTRGTMSYGCNDDTDYSGGNYTSTAISNRIIPAGTMVTIVVATLAMADNAAGAAYGLQIDEVPPIAAGAMCDVTDEVDTCADGSTCVGTVLSATCVANGTRYGTRCRATGMACDAGLTCVDGETERYCFRQGTLNMPCSFEETQCPMGSSCMPTAASDGYTGVCRADGTRGGLCDATTACMMGLTCSASGDNTGACRTMGMANGECDPLGYMTACPMNSECVPGGTMGSGATMFVCAALGTAAGTSCREMGTRCDMGLACMAANGPSHCVRDVAMAGGECDPLYGTVRCMGTEVCRATSPTAGTCGAATMEPSGDNDDPAMPGAPVATPAAIRGSINPADDLDCYAVTVPAGGGSIFAATSDGAGGCPTGTATNSMGMTMTYAGDTQLFLLDSRQRVVESNDDSLTSVCSTIDGTNAASGAHNLPAGNYTVCVRSYNGSLSISSYVLHLNVTPRM